MNLVPVESVPQRAATRHRLQDLIEEFVNGDADIVRVEFGEKDYKSAKVARSCLSVAITRSRRNIKVMLRGDQIFLSKEIKK